MSLEPLHRVLHEVKQTQWQQHQQFEQLLQAWSEIVGPVVAAQTKPVRMTSKGVLQVATSSSVWAQNLAFERHRILEKLNVGLEEPMTDIRFSTGLWPLPKRRRGHQTPMAPALMSASNRHPVRSPRTLLSPQTPEDAFGQWSQVVRLQAQGRPLCPQCHCPSPMEELKRWSVCGLCAMRPPSPGFNGR